MCISSIALIRALNSISTLYGCKIRLFFDNDWLIKGDVLDNKTFKALESEHFEEVIDRNYSGTFCVKKWLRLHSPEGVGYDSINKCLVALYTILIASQIRNLAMRALFRPLRPDLAV